MTYGILCFQGHRWVRDEKNIYKKIKKLKKLIYSKTLKSKVSFQTSPFKILPTQFYNKIYAVFSNKLENYDFKLL